MDLTFYIFDHDEWDHSSQALRKHIWSLAPNAFYRQPTVFGPMPGSRQDFWGRSRAVASREARACTASIMFKTSRTLLQNLLPNDSYQFVGRGSVAYATFSQTNFSNMDWLAGGGYNLLGLFIHNVQYRSANGETTNGTYLPIMFEDLTDPILSVREEIAFPKLTAILMGQDSHEITLGWRGRVWGRISLKGLQHTDALPEVKRPAIADNGLLIHRYMPAVGKKGSADAEYPTFVSYEAEAKNVPTSITDLRRASQAEVKIDGLDWERLPTLHHIVSRLAEIPIYEVIEAKVVEGKGVGDISSIKQI